MITDQKVTFPLKIKLRFALRIEIKKNYHRKIALLVLLVTTHVWSSRVFDKNYPSGLSLRFL